MDELLQGRRVVVTGGTGALGSAAVGLFLESGAEVFVPVHREEDLQDFPYRGHERVHLTLGVELTREEDVASFFGQIEDLWASVQAAGGFRMAPLAETRLDDLRALLDTNVVTCFLACREAAARIKASGRGGRIVNVAARPALVPTAGLAAYAASKAAVAGLTASLAEELAPDGIWVNAVVPSIMDTPANRAAMPEADPTRWPAVSDVAQTIRFLASPQNRTTRGGLVPVYGRS